PRPASSARTTATRPARRRRCSSRAATSIRSWRAAAPTSRSTTSTPTGTSTAPRTTSSAATTSPALITAARPSSIAPRPPAPRGDPQWGKAWKAARAKWYQGAMNIGASGSVMANRYNWLDLDPTYRNAFGQPLMRMTFDYKENEQRMGAHAAKMINDLAKTMNP